MLLEIEENERLSAPLNIKALQDLTEWWCGAADPQMSPPLALGWDMHRQWPEHGFALWRDMMLAYEPPLLAEDLISDGHGKVLDQRRPVTMEQYEAALVEQWAEYNRPKHWVDELVVDVLASERSRGYEPCGDAFEATEAILNDLAAKVGAKRAAVQADRDAREGRRIKRLDRYFELDDAGYANWKAGGTPFFDGKKWERWDRRRFLEHLENHKMTVVRFPVQPTQTIEPRRFNAASLHGKPVPEREWLVRDLIPARNVTLLYGDGGTGKSLLALQLAVAVNTGKSFFGHLVCKGSVEFVTAEDDTDELHRRLAHVSHGAIETLDSLSGLNLTSLADEIAVLAVPNATGEMTQTTLYIELSHVLARSRPALLVLDTLADVYGGNEIVRTQVRQFVGMLRKLCVQYGCTVVVLAHPSLSGMDKGTSGSTAWNNSVRSRLYFQRILDSDGSEPDSDARVLKVLKSNYGRVGVEIPMRWCAGIFVPVDGGSSGNPLIAQAKVDRVFLELLDKAAVQNVTVHFKEGPGYAPKVFATDAMKQNIRKRDLIEAMKRLMDNGTIENAPFGPPSRIRYQLQRNARAPSNPLPTHFQPASNRPSN